MRHTSQQPQPDSRPGFTLIELLVAMSIFVIVSALTIGAINLSLTGEQVRGAARQVQSKIEGARDRAIYNSRETQGQPRPVGVRLLVDENEPTISRSLVYIESAGRDATDENGASVQVAEADSEVGAGVTGVPTVVGEGTSWSALYDRGLIGPGSIINIRDLGNNNWIPMTIHPGSFPIVIEANFGDGVGINSDGDTNDEVLVLLENHPGMPGPSIDLRYFIELGPDIMADEEPLELPRGACIDLSNSHLPDSWEVAPDQFSNRMDIMFSAQGPCLGEAAAAGIIHLHMADIDDALEGTLPGSPTTPNDFDGDGNPDERHGNELGLTIFTKAGRVISHPIATSSAVTWVSGNYALGDLVAPSVFNGLIFEAVVITMMGTSGGTEPAWGNAEVGEFFVDGDVTWLARKHDVWRFGLEGEVAR